ncbi:MAG: DUF1957 domain-containing protein [Bacteroidetes bacterium]|nr:DUF1957 domain-containing protein [Bacteroidota bacterium]
MPGSFTFVLHTHLPYVLHHGKWPFGSDWLSEAVAECYIPLLGELDRLHERGIRARISMDFSPILLEQLADPEFPDVYTEYCNERIRLAESDILLFKQSKEKQYIPLAEFWIEHYELSLRTFKSWYGGDLIEAFRRHIRSGTLDAMTCGATHGYLPLLLSDSNVRAQVRIASDTHEKHFGTRPRGIWLPECAYRPRYAWKPPTDTPGLARFETERAGIEEILAEQQLEYFVVEGALTKGGVPMPTYPEFSTTIHERFEHDSEARAFKLKQKELKSRSLSEMYAVKSTHRKLAGKSPIVFSRDRKTSEQVWSGDIGYPGDPNYLEFHKKHHNSGLRYWRVTDSKIDLADKLLYSPASVDERLHSHADHFVGLVKQTLDQHRKEHYTDGVVCSPFDTELFGHWWFEGPRFIGQVIELLENDPDIHLTNCADALDERTRPYETIALPEGSWGEGGGHYVWMNSDVKWTWDEIYRLEAAFLDALREYGYLDAPGKFLTKTMKQAARELLLLEASDWQFLITTASATEYSKKRFEKHAKRLGKLLQLVRRLLGGEEPSKKDKAYLKKVALDDRPFAEIDLAAWK